MKTTKRHFKLFKKECQKWIDVFELNNWKVNFERGGTNTDAYSTIRTKIGGYVATISFAEDWYMGGVDNIKESIQETAKHEMIHLLLARFSNYAESKHFTTGDLLEAEEELVRKLTKIIK